MVKERVLAEMEQQYELGASNRVVLGFWIFSRISSIDVRFVRSVS
jgi:hypothetical protein